MWKPYEEIRKHPADLRVNYRLILKKKAVEKGPYFKVIGQTSFMMGMKYAMVFTIYIQNLKMKKATF